MPYIVCQKKRNNPRMDIRICQKKCDMKDTCEEYCAINKSEAITRDIPISSSLIHEVA